jgi:hypothetical protein
MGMPLTGIDGSVNVSVKLPNSTLPATLIVSSMVVSRPPVFRAWSLRT